MVAMSKSFRKVRFSEADDELLIDFVSRHPVLYDMNEKDFKNAFKRELIWKEVGKLLNRTGNECKVRWKSVRDHCRKERKKGSAGKKKRAGYWKKLNFLCASDDESDHLQHGESALSAEAELEAEESASTEACEQLFHPETLPLLGASTFSQDDDELLIQFVRSHPALYDTRAKDYKDAFNKDLIWKEAGKLLNRAGIDCKKRWRSMRDHYKKQHKRGTDNIKKRASYWNQMNFLDAVDDESGSSANINNDGRSTLCEGTNLETHECASNETYEQSCHPGTIQEPHPVVFEHPKLKTAMVHDYLKEKQENRAHFKRCLEDLVAPPPEENEIDLFFKTMAATVKKFRPNLVIRAKSEVFKFVTEMELLNQQEPQQSTSGSANIVYCEIKESDSLSEPSP